MIKVRYVFEKEFHSGLSTDVFVGGLQVVLCGNIPDPSVWKDSKGVFEEEFQGGLFGRIPKVSKNKGRSSGKQCKINFLHNNKASLRRKF